MLRNWLGLIALGLAGAFVAIVGTAAHRFHPYVGVTLAIVLVLSSALFARTWRRFGGLGAFAVGWTGIALTLAYTDGPGGSTVFLDDSIGKAWIYGAAAAIVVTSFLPYRLLEGGTRVQVEA